MSAPAAHTAAPWRWFGSPYGGVYLATPDRGRKYVMSFRRYGMNAAQPAFSVGGIMVPAAELVTFEVGDRSVRGFKQARTDPTVYRGDVNGIDHPDAILIASAPTLLAELKTLRAVVVSLLDRAGCNDEQIEMSLASTDRAIAAAEGRA